MHILCCQHSLGPLQLLGTEYVQTEATVKKVKEYREFETIFVIMLHLPEGAPDLCAGPPGNVHIAPEVFLHLPVKVKRSVDILLVPLTKLVFTLQRHVILSNEERESQEKIMG